MFRAEMRKILRPGIIGLIILISVLMYYSFMSWMIKPFKGYDGTDSMNVKMEICKDLINKYGNSIEEEAPERMINGYQDMQVILNSFIAGERLFSDNGVNNYNDFRKYEQNAINGIEGYDYNIYAGMRNLIEHETEESTMYYAEYESIIQKYEESGRTRPGILPFEIITYASDFFVYLIIGCMVCAFLLAAPVMVTDRAENVLPNQYSSKKGKKIFGLQYLCMNVSVTVLVSILMSAALLIWWKSTETQIFADSAVNSFMNSKISVINLTYGQMINYYIIIAYILTLGSSNIVFFLSSNSVNVISMLIKAVPVLIVGCLVGLLMKYMCCTDNSIYKVFRIPYCEVMVAAIIFILGISLNILYYCRVNYIGN